MTPLHWRHNDHDGVSNHQPYGCLLNRLFRRRSKKTSKLRVTGLCVGNSPGPVNSSHKGSVTRKMFPFIDVIMQNSRAMLKPRQLHKANGLCLFVLAIYWLCLLLDAASHHNHDFNNIANPAKATHVFQVHTHRLESKWEINVAIPS